MSDPNTPVLTCRRTFHLATRLHKTQKAYDPETQGAGVFVFEHHRWYLLPPVVVFRRGTGAVPPVVPSGCTHPHRWYLSSYTRVGKHQKVLHGCRAQPVVFSAQVPPFEYHGWGYRYGTSTVLLLVRSYTGVGLGKHTEQPVVPLLPPDHNGWYLPEATTTGGTSCQLARRLQLQRWCWWRWQGRARGLAALPPKVAFGHKGAFRWQKQRRRPQRKGRPRQRCSRTRNAQTGSKTDHCQFGTGYARATSHGRVARSSKSDETRTPWLDTTSSLKWSALRPKSPSGSTRKTPSRPSTTQTSASRSSSNGVASCEWPKKPSRRS